MRDDGDRRLRVDLQNGAHRVGKAAMGVVGAFLVAPSSEGTFTALPDADPAFTPFPREPLPFPSLLIASQSDPYCAYQDAGDMALAWGSMLVDAGNAGSLDPASGHGPWPEGAMRFVWFLKQLGTPKMA